MHVSRWFDLARAQSTHVSPSQSVNTTSSTRHHPPLLFTLAVHPSGLVCLGTSTSASPNAFHPFLHVRFTHTSGTSESSQAHSYPSCPVMSHAGQTSDRPPSPHPLKRHVYAVERAMYHVSCIIYHVSGRVPDRCAMVPPFFEHLVRQAPVGDSDTSCATGVSVLGVPRGVRHTYICDRLGPSRLHVLYNNRKAREATCAPTCLSVCVCVGVFSNRFIRVTRTASHAADVMAKEAAEGPLFSPPTPQKKEYLNKERKKKKTFPL